MVKVIRKSFSISLLIITSTCHADVFDYDIKSVWGENKNIKVIHDSGNTVSINEFYRKVEGSAAPKNNKLALNKELAKALKKMGKPDSEIIEKIKKGHFPVAPEIITVSSVVKKVNLRDIPHIQENMFIVGNDNYSLQWAIDNKDELIRFNAIGVLTKVESIDEFKKIKRLLKPLRLMPVSADFISSNFDVWTYPVLITAKGEFR